MPDKSQATRSEPSNPLRELEELQAFGGSPREFWTRFLSAAARLIGADKIILLGKETESSDAWRSLSEWPEQTPPSRMLKTFLAKLQELAGACGCPDGVVLPLEPASASSGNYMLALRVPVPGNNQESWALVCLVSEVTELKAREALVRLKLAAGIPTQYQLNAALRQATADVEKFAGTLDLMLLMAGQQRFLAAGMAMCNGMASRHHCDRVSLGFLRGHLVKVQAISRTEKFNRQMAAVQSLEKAMEEAFDQDDEILWPASEGANVVTREHEQFAKDQGVQYLCSIPVRSGKKPVGVLTCERQSSAFTANELQQFRLLCELIAEPLVGLQRRDRWFGARWANVLKEQAAKIVGVEHTWAKVLILAITMALLIVFFVPVPYRVEGTFVLRSDELSHLTAPFDGYIQQVLVRPGDQVKAGDALLGLRTDELQLEEAAALADLARYNREAEKARAAGDFAEMLVNQAIAEQTQAKLGLVRYRLMESVIKAPFDGVVIEGDLRDRLGAPVKAADVLMRVARIDTLYVEAEIDERDVHQLVGKSSGEIAFLSQPRKKFPVRIVNLEQAAFPRSKGNVFLVHCTAQDGPRDWWRPGMSGVCKFNVSKRTLFWIFTHRTVDFLRMKLWW